MHRISCELSAAALALLGCAELAAGQWNATFLHPPGLQESQAFGVDPFHQVGRTATTISERAALWSGSALQWIDLTPTAATSASISSTSNGRHAGWARVNGVIHASYWSGLTPASWVNLEPPVALGSFATAIDGDRQVGFVFVPGTGYQASLWTGTAQSWVNLHPAGYDQSFAEGVNATHQVGYVMIGNQSRAARWRLTHDTFVDLHPVGADNSAAISMHSFIQVGGAQFGGQWNAAQWNNSAASFFNMHPAGETASYALSTHSLMHVGYVDTVGGQRVAALWDGQTTSYLNLHTFLPPNYVSSIANSIHVEPHCIRVVGSARPSGSNFQEAVLWRRSFCPGDLNGDCVLDFFDVQLFLTLFAAGDPRVDFNGDGMVDFFDVQFFLAVFSAGC